MNESTRIAAALAQIPDVACVTRGWPKQNARLPCIAVGLEDARPADTRDNAVYLTRQQYSVRVFAAAMSACDALRDTVVPAMEALGYTLERVMEADGETAQQTMLFVKLI